MRGKLLRVKASLYVGAAASKVSSSRHRVLIRRLMGQLAYNRKWVVRRLVDVKRFVVWFSVALVGAVIEIKG